jgi:helicase
MLRALVLGIDKHADPQIPPLRSCRADALAVGELIRDGLADDREVTVLVDEAATKPAVERYLTEDLPRRVAPDDVLLVYFAGYGAPDVDPATADPSVHVVLHDTRFADLSASSLNVVSELSGWLRRLPVGMVTTVLDASFNGAPGGRSFEGPGLWSGPRLRHLERTSCARLAFGMQCAVLTACTDKEVAGEDDQHGVFTRHLLSVLDAPSMRGTAIRLDSLRTEVLASILAASGTQTPVLHGTASGRVLFRLAPSRPEGASEMSNRVDSAVHSIGHGPTAGGALK